MLRTTRLLHEGDDTALNPGDGVRHNAPSGAGLLT